MADNPEAEVVVPPGEHAAEPGLDGSAQAAARALELALVLGLVCGAYIMSSVAQFAGLAQATSSDGLGVWRRILASVLAVALLAYVLSRRGKSLRAIGFTPGWTDVPWAIALTAAAFGSNVAVGLFLNGTYGGTALHLFANAVAGIQLGRPVALLSELLNAAREELVVRAYLITEIVDLTGSTALAIALSAVFQTSYHLYQGSAAAVLALLHFLILSMYYAITRRAVPVLLSHFLYNVIVMGSTVSHP